VADTVVDSVTVVGFGLIGASLAAALGEKAPGVRVSAIDLPEVATLPDARRRVSTLASSEDEELCRQLVAESTITVLAGPVGIILSELPGYLALAQVLTDCGSTKRQIAASVDASPRRGRFVPGHPMAGKTERGFQAAEAKLFEGKPWIYCPEGCDHDAVTAVLELTRCVDFRNDPRGGEYLWVGTGGVRHSGDENSDTAAYDAGEVGVTPLSLELWASEHEQAAVEIISKSCAE
jgi:prephenate dehydrogenase